MSSRTANRRYFRAPKAGALAIDPRALGIAHEPHPDMGGMTDDCEETDGVAVVTIEGPLMHRASSWWDSYEAIEQRFYEALKSGAHTVLLRIDSPGGVVAGCFEAVRRMRAAAEATDVHVVAYADEQICSAAYALATVAYRIYLPESAEVGSIGVIASLCDQTAANEKAGLNVVVIRSGDEKADGHPDIPLEQDTIDRMQERIDNLAQQFGELVAENRGGDAEDWLELKGGVREGQAAVDAGLAEEVISLDALMVRLIEGSNLGVAAPDSAARVENMAAKKKPSKTAASAQPAARYKKSKKTEEVEESDEGSEDEESEDEESDEDAEDEESEDEADEDADDSEDDEDDDEDDGPPSSKPGKKAEAYILEVARALTGKSNAAEVAGALRGLAESAAVSRRNAREIERLKAKARRADVAKMIDKAVRERKITPAAREHFEKIGLRSPRELRAMLETLPAVARGTETEHPKLPAALGNDPDNVANKVAANFGVTIEQMAEAAARNGGAGQFPRN